MNNECDYEFYHFVVSKHLRDMFVELEDNDFFDYIDVINISVDGIKQEVKIDFLKDYE